MAVLSPGEIMEGSRSNEKQLMRFLMRITDSPRHKVQQPLINILLIGFCQVLLIRRTGRVLKLIGAEEFTDATETKSIDPSSGSKEVSRSRGVSSSACSDGAGWTFRRRGSSPAWPFKSNLLPLMGCLVIGQAGENRLRVGQPLSPTAVRVNGCGWRLGETSLVSWAGPWPWVNSS